MSRLSVETRHGQLVVDSRLIAEELGVSHKAFLETLRKHQTKIEQAFGQLPFETAVVNGHNGGGNPEKYAYLNEEQASFAMTLSKNTPQVIQAKLNLVKKFSEAKKQLAGKVEVAQQPVTNDILNTLATKLEIDALKNQIVPLAILTTEYLTVRKYSDSILPGLSELIDDIAETKGKLPSVRIEFTAPEWVNSHASNLSQRQRVCFYKEVAAAHRFLVGEQPQKIKGMYRYSNKYEIIFERAKMIAESMIPVESKLPALPPAITYQELASLTENEQSLIGEKMKLRTVSACLGNIIRPTDTNTSSRLGLYVMGFVKKGELSKPSNKHFTVTPKLVEIVKTFHKEQNHG